MDINQEYINKKQKLENETSSKELEEVMLDFANKEVPEAMYDLANLLMERSKDNEKELSNAISWLYKAVEKEYAPAEYLYGSCFMDGYGVPKDNQMGVVLWMRASDHGYDEATYMLGVIYHHGKVIEKDEAKSLEYLNKAAKNDYTQAYVALGFAYYYGFGVDKDVEKARSNWEKAANKGDAKSAFNVAFSYYENKMYKESLPWYEKAVENGMKEAQMQVYEVKNILKYGKIDIDF